MNGHPSCATVGQTGALYLSACPTSGAAVPAAQAFSKGVDGRITTGEGKLCLTSGPSSPKPPLTNTANIWVRPLAGGAASAVFLNVGEEAADVTCDANCLKVMGFDTADKVTVSDLWAGTTTSATGSITAKALAPDGGHMMVKVTKSS